MILRPHRTAERLRSDESGAIIVMTTLILLAMIGMSALVLDIAFLRHDKRASQTAADMGAVAGALDLPVVAQGAGLEACRTAWGYVIENTAIPTNSPDPCVPARWHQCNLNSPATAVGTVDPYTVTITWPVLDDSPLMRAREDETDGDPCERIAVQIERDRGFLFARIWGISEGFTTGPAVARFADDGNEEIIASLIVLHREDCSTLTASGQGKIWVRATDEEPGIIAVDSVGSTSPGNCHNNDPYVIDPGTSQNTQIRAGVDENGDNAAGRILSWTLTEGAQKWRAYRPNTFPRLAPNPVSSPRRITRAIGDHHFNCKQTYPTAFAIDGCGDWETELPHIDRLHDGIGGGTAQPPATSPYPEYGDLVFRRYTDYANATFGGPGFNPCNLSSSDPVITLPNGATWDGWWIDCTTWSISNTVAIEGGHVVTNGAVSMGSHGRLYVNQRRNPGPPVTYSPNDADVFFYVRSGNLSKGGQATLSLHRTMVYLRSGATALGGGDQQASLRWTAPHGGVFAKLALWSDSTTTHSIAGQGNLTLEGVYFVPRARFEINGQGNQVQTARAQFIASKLAVGGQGTISLVPDPEFNLPWPVYGAALIR